MTDSNHFAAASNLLEDAWDAMTDADRRDMIAAAQVHALIAIAERLSR